MPRRSCSARYANPYGVQDRSVPAISVESVDASAGHRICDETDAAWPSLAVVPALAVPGVLPADALLPAAAPVVPTVAAPTGLLVLCTKLLPGAALLVTLFPELALLVTLLPETALPVALLPEAALPAALLPEMVSGEFVPNVFGDVLEDELALLPACVLIEGVAVVAAAPVPTPPLVVVPAVCARAGVARVADTTRAVVTKRMAITDVCAVAGGGPPGKPSGPTRQIGIEPDDHKTHLSCGQALPGPRMDFGRDRALRPQHSDVDARTSVRRAVQVA